jgi:TrmH family RNA methyltransferase
MIRMLPKALTSLQHPIVKHCVDLRQKRKYRYEQREAVVPGMKMVRELAAEKPCKVLFISEQLPDLPPAEQCYLITEQMMKKLTGLPSPEPMAALFSLPSEGSLSGKTPLLVLDQISDPGNMGTLIRTALAFGFEGAYILGEATDPFHDRAIRASKGAVFRLPLAHTSHRAFATFAEAEKLSVLIADAHGTDIKQVPSGVDALVLGSESHGPSKPLLDQFPSTTIPMPGKMESLNVAAAGAILMYSLRKES